MKETDLAWNEKAQCLEKINNQENILKYYPIKKKSYKSIIRIILKKNNSDAMLMKYFKDMSFKNPKIVE